MELCDLLSAAVFNNCQFAIFGSEQLTGQPDRSAVDDRAGFGREVVMMTWVQHKFGGA
jgi:hypothetical protein